jgi:uroporphyrinogen-III synthase
MKVLVTRPADDGAEIARALAAMGHDALLAPLLTVQFHPGPLLSLDGVQAILATSANGVRALAGRTALRDVPVFAVGPQTAAAARDAGFIRVRNADGDAGTLAERAAEWADPAEGLLLHATGEEGGGALCQALAQKGFSVRREALYRVVAVDHLPPAPALALEQGALDAALFFSPRSAQIFVACVQRAGLTTQALIAACISENTAKSLLGLDFSEIRVATSPNQAALLDCL